MMQQPVQMTLISAFTFVVMVAISGGPASTIPATAVASVLEQASQPAPSSGVVKARSFVSIAPVPRGKEFQVAVAVDIANGYHMNSHHPSDEYLIPTTLTPKLPAGLQLVDTVYPAGRERKFSFSPDKPLDVYSGSVTLKLRLSAQADAPIGAATISMTLRYQACNDTTCLPPMKLPVDVTLDIAPANAKTRAQHPEIFSAAGST
jgi:thiol:disulfide interchange protein DsbD